MYQLYIIPKAQAVAYILTFALALAVPCSVNAQNNSLGTKDNQPLITTGNVGIGTTSPGTKLHVLGPGGGAVVATFEQPAGMNFVELRSSSVGGNYGTDLMFRDSGKVTAEIKSTANGQLRFATNNTRPDKLVIDGAGNVGIGIPTENPGRTLDVEGPVVSATGSSAFLVAADAGGAASLWTNATYNRGSPFDGWVRTLTMVGGKVGIGTTSPEANMEVQGSADPLLLINHTGAIGNPALWFKQDGGQPKAYVWWDKENNRLNVGTPTTNPIASFQNDGTTTVKALQITGGADLSEHFEVRGAAEVGSAASPIQAGLVVSIDPNEPGKLAVSSQAYDHKVAGVISGAGGVRPGMLMSQSGSMADGDHPVALTGRVYCWADASYGPIAPGDLLTTSNTPGHAMKVTDYAKAQGAVLGKAMAELKQGKGLVLALVTLQ